MDRIEPVVTAEVLESGSMDVLSVKENMENNKRRSSIWVGGGGGSRTAADVVVGAV